MEYTVMVMPNGSVQFLYNDDHPLLEIGNVQMVRASNVLWDEENQLWFIYFNGSVGVTKWHHGFKNRKDAIAFEVSFLNAQLGIDPEIVIAFMETQNRDRTDPVYQNDKK